MTRALWLSAALLATAHLQAAGWEELPRLPEPNGGFVCGVSGTKLVIAGGTNWDGGVKNWLSSIHRYDPAKRAWDKAVKLESAVAYGMALQDGAEFSIVGGSDGKQALRTRVDIREGKPVGSVVRDMPATVVLSAGGLIGGRFVFAGGVDDAANLAVMSRATTEVSISDGPAARALSDFPGKPFCIAASSVVRDELFVFGGANWDAAANAVVNASEAYAFLGKTNSWRRLRSLPFAVRGLTGVALDDHRIYLAGGFKSEPEGFSSDALIYDVKADSYAPARSLPYAGMVGLVLLEGHVYCLGGEDKMKSRTDKFFRIAVEDLSTR